MHFTYTRQGLSGAEKIQERVFEILPGAVSWLIIIGMSVSSVIEPLAAAVCVIAFLFYWLLRLMYMNIFLVLSYVRLAIEKQTSWMERVGSLEARAEITEQCGIPGRQSRAAHRLSCWLHRRQIVRMQRGSGTVPRSSDIYHLVIIPVIREAREIVEPGIQAIVGGEYPAQRILLIVALEDRANAVVKRDMEELRVQYRSRFREFIVSVHPSGAAGEARVKGANVTCAARRAAEYFAQEGIAYERVLVSCFDADTVPQRNYFGCLTYHFLTTPDRTRASYQPIPVYHNNIWSVPAFARIIDIGTSFFQLIEATNPRKMVTFSSHSMSFRALVDVGYWPVDMVSDDSAIFWKAFIHYEGKYRVVPIYTTVSMDIAAGAGAVRTFVSIYKQKRRWAWGVENVPIVMRAFLKPSAISLRQKLAYGFKLLDMFIAWATWPFLITFGAWLPAAFAGRGFTSSTVYYTVPRIQSTIFSLASVGLVSCMIISLLLLPRRNVRGALLKHLRHVGEWLFIPFIIMLLSAVPALDAQTRLMLGKYMEFWVAEKSRSRSG